MPTLIVFNQIIVNSMNENATISTGETSQPDWSVQGKQNQANGQLAGFQVLAGNLNVILDNDVVDTPVNASELFNPQPVVQT